MNRFFIGPLTEAQQERRRKARYKYREVEEIQDARHISFTDALRVWAHQQRDRFGLAFLRQEEAE